MNPLLDVHRQANAQTQPYGEMEIVATFGEVPAEYAAIRKGSALLDLTQRALLELTGRDRLAFLNNLISNQTYDKQSKTGLAAGQGVYAFLLNARSGRIICDLNVIERNDRTLLELDRRVAPTVAETLEKYRFAEQVKIRNLSDDLHEMVVLGPRAPFEQLPPFGSSEIEMFGSQVIVWRDDPTASPGYHLVVPIQEARKLWMNLIAQQIRPIGWAAFNATRIEAGRPLFGIDFDDSLLPHETGPLLERAVSFTKGCYPGQEIVARMQARGGTARKIVGMRMADDALPIAGSKIYDEAGNEIGGVTSSTISPVLSNAAIALGIVKRPHFNVGSGLAIPAEGQMRKAMVVEVPFVK
jgi:folate-binding protein YgfZ